MHRTAYLILLLTMLLWAGNVIAGKLAVGHVSPMLLAMLRWGLALPILLAIGFRRLPRDMEVLRRHLPYLLLMGVLGFTIYSVAMYCALLYTSAINISIEQGGMPLLVFAASFVLFRTRVGLAQFVGFTLSFAGVMLTALHGDFRRLFSLEMNFGDALMLVAVVSYGLYTAGLRLKPDLHWSSLMAALCVGGFVSAIPFAVAEAALGSMILPDWQGWAIIAFVVLFPSILSQILYIRAVEMIGANRAGLFVNFMPLWGALLSVLILGEAVHLYHAVALTMVLGGIMIAEYGGHRMAVREATTTGPEAPTNIH
ncbi:MAG: DMT family transporter [Pseudaminobacter sp.]